MRSSGRVSRQRNVAVSSQVSRREMGRDLFFRRSIQLRAGTCDRRVGCSSCAPAMRVATVRACSCAVLPIRGARAVVSQSSLPTTSNGGARSNSAHRRRGRGMRSSIFHSRTPRWSLPTRLTTRSAFVRAIGLSESPRFSPATRRISARFNSRRRAYTCQRSELGRWRPSARSPRGLLCANHPLAMCALKSCPLGSAMLPDQTHEFLEK